MQTQTQKETKIEKIRRKNMEELLGGKIERDLKAFRAAFGILKNMKKTGVQYQRELRREKKKRP